MSDKQHTNHDVLKKIGELYEEVFAHDGYGDIRVEMRILRRGQKEIILHCGKQYRFLVDFKPANQERPAKPEQAVRAALS